MQYCFIGSFGITSANMKPEIHFHKDGYPMFKVKIEDNVEDSLRVPPTTSKLCDSYEDLREEMHRWVDDTIDAASGTGKYKDC